MSGRRDRVDSTFPPAANTYRDGLANTNRAFETLFHGCQADWRCRLAYPDLRQRFYELVNRLNAQPVTVQAENPKTGRQSEMVANDSLHSSS